MSPNFARESMFMDSCLLFCTSSFFFFFFFFFFFVKRVYFERNKIAPIGSKVFPLGVDPLFKEKTQLTSFLEFLSPCPPKRNRFTFLGDNSFKILLCPFKGKIFFLILKYPISEVVLCSRKQAASHKLVSLVRRWII